MSEWQQVLERKSCLRARLVSRTSDFACVRIMRPSSASGDLHLMGKPRAVEPLLVWSDFESVVDQNPLAPVAYPCCVVYRLG